jgi:two-component system sensor histidine kinase QseC
MVEGERRFTADAAHELRTPIAAIRAHVQVAQLVQGDQRAQALTATLQGCDRATRLVEQLLQLARLENGAIAASTQINLGAVARRVCAGMAPAALERRQSLSLDAPDQAGICADEILTEVLLRNLLDNASRYSPDAATIQACVRQTADGVELCVQDSGPGLAEADMQRLGQRFFRVLGSDQSGSGLGWSIVRRIARVQGAQIDVSRSTQLGGLEVRVLWPQAKLGA